MTKDKFTVKDFFARFPDDQACLDHIMNVRYGMTHTCEKCGVAEATFHKLTERKAYSCAHCGHHVYPCAGTIFQDSRTSLQTWFYAIYLFVTTRHGVSGKELQRSLGVTYKCAYRMGQQIRMLMAKADGFEILHGHIEADETYVGGYRPGKRGRGAGGKTIVMGMMERDGRINAEVIPNVKLATLKEVVNRNVARGSTVSTDELMSYGLLKSDGYEHGTVRHGAKQYAKFDEEKGINHHTNSVEGFWRLFKNSIRSTHIHVSDKYMQSYLDEFTFRNNKRKMGNAMFDLLIAAI